jgi:hypothetical protein
MLQDFSFKIVHRPGMRHANADALSQNPVGQAVDDDDFRQEIKMIQTYRMEWLRQLREFWLFDMDRIWIGLD